MQNKKYYHSLSVLNEVGYIAGFVLNCQEFVGLCYDSLLVTFSTLASINIHLQIFLTLTLVNIT